jgi:hypothetical protein
MRQAQLAPSVSLRTYHIQLSGMVKDGESTRMLKLAAERGEQPWLSLRRPRRLRAPGGRRCARAPARAASAMKDDSLAR